MFIILVFECENKFFFFDINELSFIVDLLLSCYSGFGIDLILLMVLFVYCIFEEFCWFLLFVVVVVKGKKIVRLNY